MPQVYLVKVTFKAGGKVFLAGDLLEDLSEVRLFKVRMNEGKLVPLPQGKDLENLAHFFKEKYAIDLNARIAERASKGSKIAEVTNPNVNVIPPTGTPATPTGAAPKGFFGGLTKPQPLSGAQTQIPANNTIQK